MRDYYSQAGAKVDLQLIGELLSNLGPHVSSGEIPTNMAFRLQTACVINWKESFALILKSSHITNISGISSEGLLKLKVIKLILSLKM